MQAVKLRCTCGKKLKSGQQPVTCGKCGHHQHTATTLQRVTCSNCQAKIKVN